MLMVLSGDSLQVLIESEAGNNITFSLDFRRDFLFMLWLYCCRMREPIVAFSLRSEPGFFHDENPLVLDGSPEWFACFWPMRERCLDWYDVRNGWYGLVSSMKSFLRWFLGIFVGISAPGSCGDSFSLVDLA